MLISTEYSRHQNNFSGLDSVHNYYKQLVLDQIARVSDRAQQDVDFFADVACVALNRLPPRYIRYNVDMTFFLSPMELGEIYDKVELAVNEAITYVTERDELKKTKEKESKAIAEKINS